MRTTRIDVEGAQGEATITREGDAIHIVGKRVTKVIEKNAPPWSTKKEQGFCLVHEPFTLQADAREGERNRVVASLLHQYLEGRHGTNGDVDAYFRAIQALAD